MVEYRQFFGNASPEGASITVTIDESQTPVAANGKIDEVNRSKYLMYYSLQAFFANGGGPCYIVSVGDYSGGGVIAKADLDRGLEAVQKVDEVTLLLFPDSMGLTSSTDYYDLHKAALDQCAELGDRFTVCDVWIDPADTTANNVQTLRDSGLGSSVDILKYGAVYYPRLETSLDFEYDATLVQVDVNGSVGPLSDLEGTNNVQFNLAKNAITQIPMILPASCPVVGVYAQVDETRGVWKAPANVNIDQAIRPVLKINDKEQEDLNVDVTGGKSINAIRSFTGRGPAIIWGARTLAGNDNEWRYVPVRRFFNMAEESIKKATIQFVFEPNDANTWVRVRSMIENFLVLQWRAGALAGPTPESAFFVRVGLGQTMTPQDILEGRMIVEIGMAVVRPAEFIILRFSHKMQEA